MALSDMDIVAVNSEATLLISGAIDDWESIRNRGVTTIVDLEGGIDPGAPESPNQVLYVYFPMQDEGLPDLTKLDAIGRMVAGLIRDGQAVLVHCLLGANRSALLAGVALTYLGMTGQHAVERLRAVSPGALFNPIFADWLWSLPARDARPRPRIKVCCVMSLEEMRLAVSHGAVAVGLVSQMPSGPGVIPEDRIAEIAAATPPGVEPVLLTCSQDVAAIAEQQRRTGVRTLQLCDALPAGGHQALRRALPGIRQVQVVHVKGAASVDEARAIGPGVDALLLDSGDPSLAVKELGGTGRRHDWSVSRRIRDAVPTPLFLAGGLTADNVAQAVRQVDPYGLDVCSGLRSEGRLDAAKLGAFTAAVAAASG